jgi:hypothetical protein
MSLAELEEATGLGKNSLEEALHALGGPNGRDDSRIAYGAGRVVLGGVWRVQCRDLPNDPGPGRPSHLATVADDVVEDPLMAPPEPPSRASFWVGGILILLSGGVRARG